MIIALYGHTVSDEHIESIKLLFSQFKQHSAEVIVFSPFFNFLKKQAGYEPSVKGVFHSASEVKSQANLMVSIGGDGTFLESVSFVEESSIPVAGINFGRLGFLAHITSENISEAFEQLLRGEYTVEKRSALQIYLNNRPFGDFPYALNDVTIQKNGTTMIAINAYIDEEFLCTYWADGIIVSTPTGSTAYSLSVGGPIVSPSSNAFVISPIAPHHLTVRPLVIPDSSKLVFEVDAREGEILISLDSRSFKVPSNSNIRVSKAPFYVGIVNLRDTSYYKTLRNKMMWGVDRRNV
jgi:NAD+ kinase